MPCYNCNYQYGRYDCAVCRGQAPNFAPGAIGQSKAFEVLGEGIGIAVMWFLTNRFTSFISFYFAAQTMIYTIMSVVGLLDQFAEAQAVPSWAIAINVVVPVALIIVYRKKMPLLSVETWRWVLIIALLRLFWWVMTAPPNMM